MQQEIIWKCKGKNFEWFLGRADVCFGSGSLVRCCQEKVRGTAEVMEVYSRPLG